VTELRRPKSIPEEPLNGERTMRKFFIAVGLSLLLAPSAVAEDYCHRPDEARLGTHGCYENKNGDSVHRPAASDAIPDGATARCRDGDFSFSRHHADTCSSHGGVAVWLR
jgi:hypothetical protein